MLGERLLAAGAVRPQDLDLAVRAQRHLQIHHPTQAMTLAEVLLAYRFCDEAAIAEALAGTEEGFQVQSLDLPYHIRKRLGVKVLGFAAGRLSVAAVAPLTALARQELIDAAELQGVSVEEVVEAPRDMSEVLASLAGSVVDTHNLARHVEEFNTNPVHGAIAVKDLIRELLHDALERRASDIHLDRAPGLLANLVSYRIDGQMRPVYLLTPEACAALASRVKQDCGMDATNVAVAQDGRMDFDFARRKVDVRVNCLPVEGGETLALRLLDPKNLKPLPVLMREHPAALERTVSLARLPPKASGLVLVTGPTGAGKSTTLYGIVQAAHRTSLKVMTVEDPPEQMIPVARQTPLNPLVGMTYPAVLRAQLRQDCDVLVVGETRDAETAEAALRTAESGHVLMTTLHTASVSEAISRMLGMLSEDYRPVGLLTMARHLLMVSNQKLVRRLCVCARHAPAAGEDRDSLRGMGADADALMLGVAVGCPRCEGTGYFGRVLVPEVLHVPHNAMAVRERIRRILDEGEAPERICELEGVFYYSREDALLALLAQRVIDLPTAATAMGAGV